jgi:hypothetical protein
LDAISLVNISLPYDEGNSDGEISENVTKLPD